MIKKHKSMIRVMGKIITMKVMTIMMVVIISIIMLGIRCSAVRKQFAFSFISS